MFSLTKVKFFKQLNKGLKPEALRFGARHLNDKKLKEPNEESLNNIRVTIFSCD